MNDFREHLARLKHETEYADDKFAPWSDVLLDITSARSARENSPFDNYTFLVIGEDARLEWDITRRRDELNGLKIRVSDGALTDKSGWCLL